MPRVASIFTFAFLLFAVGNLIGAPLEAPSGLIKKQEPPRVVPRVLEKVTPANASVVINLTKQRAYLMTGGEVAIDTPVSTGKAGHPTPAGSFSITEKKPDHRSNIYGSFVDSSGRIVRGGVSTKIDSAPSGTRFTGAPMKYWMRLTDYGVGMHVGQLPGYAASHGCIRLPEEIAARIFEKVKLGTPVRIER